VNALIATVIVIGRRDRVDEAAVALDDLRDRGAVRKVLISEGTSVEASPDEKDNTIRIDGLSPRYVDNAVAWLRLSSLPAVVWWRGGSPDALARLAHLADRLVLDTDPPDEMWPRAPALFDQTALTDLRWSSLTRWRAALAHLFDLPQVRQSVRELRTVEIEAGDRAAARLFAGWLRSCLAGKADLEIRIMDGPAGARTPLTRVRVSGAGPGLTLQVQEGQTCLQASVDGAEGARMVPLGDGTLASRFVEEIGVRSRDAAFERALQAAVEIGA
jgi:glucose-6-phosphate dehydrogenase assembly protein OpcA